ncbi:MAG TPA: nickel-responsive transcriptional regulator NikR [Alloacidobacterium sp.]|nr:nickel-responsive transcriptional regulator NikR [Alloacidobacterium sp.]
MGVLSRIGVALDSDLLERFDHFISRLGYTNRSEAFRDLIRDRLVAERTAVPNAIVVGTVTLIYDHHAHGVTEKLTELQHANHDLVVSTSHAHLNRDSCLEVLIVHGKSQRVEEFAGHLIGLKGVQHGRLVMTGPHEFPRNKSGDVATRAATQIAQSKSAHHHANGKHHAHGQ